MQDATAYIDNEPYSVLEADDGSIALLRRRQGPLDIVNWLRRWRFGNATLARSMEDRPLPWLFFAIVFAAVMVAVGTGSRPPPLGSEGTVEYLWVALVLVAGATVAFWQHRHRPQWVFDAHRRLVIRKVGRGHRTLSFDDLEGVYWWHNRWKAAGGREETQASCFEVYYTVNDAREVVAWFKTRSAAERLCRQLQDLVAES